MNYNYTNGEQNQSSGFATELFEWLEAIAFALAIVVLLFTFALRIVSVDGTSMTPTLQDTDRILVRNIMYTPEDNDIVIIIAPVGNDPNKPLVKRVIATGGEYVQIIDGVAYVGTSPDNMVPREVPNVEKIREEKYGDMYDFSAPVYVPQGFVFVMGDNRNDSLDSRSSMLGMVDNRCILGKVIFRIYPFNHFGKIVDGGMTAALSPVPVMY